MNIDKQSLLDLDRDDLTELTIDALKALTLQIACDNSEIPTGFSLISSNKNVKWTFDVIIKEEMTAEGKEDFKDFSTSKRINEAEKQFRGKLFKSVIYPGDLDES